MEVHYGKHTTQWPAEVIHFTRIWQYSRSSRRFGCIACTRTIDSIIPDATVAARRHTQMKTTFHDDRERLKNSIGRHAIEVNIVRVRCCAICHVCWQKRLARIELERCNERRCRNIKSRSASGGNVPPVHLHANDGAFFFSHVYHEGWRSFRNYTGGIITHRCLDSCIKMLTQPPLLLTRSYNASWFRCNWGNGQELWWLKSQLVLYVNSASSCKFGQTPVAPYDIFERYRYSVGASCLVRVPACPDTRHSKMQRGFNYSSAL